MLYDYNNTFINPDEIKNVLKQLNKNKVCVIGDILLDKYTYMDYLKIAHESPSFVYKVLEEKLYLGGAGNIVNNLINLNIETNLLSVLGSDQKSKPIVEILNRFSKTKNKQYLKHELLFDKSRTPLLRQRFLEQFGKQVMRIDSGDEHKISNYFENNIIEELNTYKDLTNIIIQDRNKGVVTQNIIDGIYEYKKKINNKVLITYDPDPRNKLNFKNKVDIILPNKREAFKLANIDYDQNDTYTNLEDEKFRNVGKIIYDKYNIEKIFITLGSEGIAYFKNGILILICKTVNQPEILLSGLGDTIDVVISTLLLNEKLNVSTICVLANLAATCILKNYTKKSTNRLELLKEYTKYYKEFNFNENQ